MFVFNIDPVYFLFYSFLVRSLLYIANLRLPTEKAYGIQIAKTCEAFADSGLGITLLYPKRNNPNIKENIFDYYSVQSVKNNFEAKRIWAPDFYFPGKLDIASVLIKSLISAIFLSAYALFKKSDIIYSRDELPLFLLSFFKRNLIFEAHNLSKSRKIFYRRFKKRNIKLVVITKYLREDFTKTGFKPENILVASDGVDLGEFQLIKREEREKKQKELREKLFTNHFDSYRRKKIAVYIGNLYTWKGADILISVAEYLKQHNPNFLIWIVGGADKDVENLKRGMHPNIVPFYGRLPHKDIAKILVAADCAILTGKETETISARYTSPLKMFEYMASGCPIVAQDLPSFREVLNENNSVLAKAGDAKDLAEKIAWVFDDNNKELVERIARKALEDVQEYTWAKRAEKIIGFF